MDGKEAPETDGTNPVPAAVSGSVAGPVGVVVGSLADAMTELNALVQVADVALEDDWSGEDLLERAKENRLQRLGVVRRLESELAAVKALTIAEYVGIEDALTPPDLGITHQRAREISLIAEVGGILGLGAGAAADLVSTSYQLAATQPLTLAALAAGEITYQHARVLTDECTGLPHAGTTALETHFLTPTLPDPTLPDPALPDPIDVPDPAGADPADPLLTPAPDPAAGSVLAGRCVAAVLVPGRLRAKVRSWRERHHPESIEERHVRSAADRRVEFTPARDGMAWLSACLPAASAEAIHNRLTAISRGQQGPHETRTLPQRRADNLVEALLTAGLTPTQHKPTTSTAVTGPAATNVGAAEVNAGSDAPRFRCSHRSRSHQSGSRRSQRRFRCCHWFRTAARFRPIRPGFRLGFRIRPGFRFGFGFGGAVYLGQGVG